MAKPRPWTVDPHGPLTQLEPNLWHVTGSLPNMALERRMTVARDESNGLWIHSAIALDDESMKRLEALGTPKVLIVPSRFHRLDAHAYKQRYPGLRVHCPALSRRQVEEMVSVDADYDGLPADATVKMVTLRGVKSGEGALVVKHGDRTSLVFNDVLFNVPHARGFIGFVLKHITASTGGPKVSRLFRVGAVSDAKALAAHLRELAETPGLTRLVPGHGDLIEQDAANVLRSVAAPL